MRWKKKKDLGSMAKPRCACPPARNSCSNTRLLASLARSQAIGKKKKRKNYKEKELEKEQLQQTEEGKRRGKKKKSVWRSVV